MNSGRPNLYYKLYYSSTDTATPDTINPEDKANIKATRGYTGCQKFYLSTKPRSVQRSAEQKEAPTQNREHAIYVQPGLKETIYNWDQDPRRLKENIQAIYEYEFIDAVEAFLKAQNFSGYSKTVKSDKGDSCVVVLFQTLICPPPVAPYQALDWETENIVEAKGLANNSGPVAPTVTPAASSPVSSMSSLPRGQGGSFWGRENTNGNVNASASAAESEQRMDMSCGF